MCTVHVHCTGNIQTVRYALAMIATVLSVCLQFVRFSFRGPVHVVDDSIQTIILVSIITQQQYKNQIGGQSDTRTCKCMSYSFPECNNACTCVSSMLVNFGLHCWVEFWVLFRLGLATILTKQFSSKSTIGCIPEMLLNYLHTYVHAYIFSWVSAHLRGSAHPAFWCSYGSRI